MAGFDRMDSMRQWHPGYSRLLRKKQKKAIRLSGRIAFLQYIAALLAGLSALLVVIWLVWQQCEYSGITAANSVLHDRGFSDASPAGPMYLAGLKKEGAFAAATQEWKGKQPDCRIIINLPSRTLDFYKGDDPVKTYPVAIGKPATPTPVGNFSIRNKEVNPWWYPPQGKRAVASGPDNPLGYRWMEFAPLYGIHGTNAPWAIGGWVSNGCVRMREADVEELFEMVPYGAKVYIQYELVRIEKSPAGQVFLGVYSDVYGLAGHPVTAAEVELKLLQAGIPDFAGNTVLNEIIEKYKGQQRPLFTMHKLKINGAFLPGQIVYSQGQYFVPIWKVADFFHADVVWEPQQQLVYSNHHVVPGVVKGQVLYVTAQDVQTIFGGIWLWQESDNSWELLTAALGKE